MPESQSPFPLKSRIPDVNSAKSRDPENPIGDPLNELSLLVRGLFREF